MARPRSGAGRRSLVGRVRAAALVVLGLGALAACTRVVTVDVDEGPVRLVVDARVLAGGFSRVVLSTTDAYSSSEVPPPVEDAVVAITDDRGGRFDCPLAGSPKGTYRCDLGPGGLGTNDPAVGVTYTLTIDYHGERYQASAKLDPVPPIDSLYFKFEAKGISQGDSGFRAVIDYSDPAGVKNFYLWELFVDGVQQFRIDPGNRFRLISEDRFYDGGEVIGYQPFDEDVVEPGSVVEVRQLSLSEEAYRYFFVLFEQTTSGGGPFATPPASVRGNVANLTNPQHRALGFFLVGAETFRIAVVPDR
ncbi:MAG: DUF4249 domain-containing protein [Gemmatimonadales bacterium]